MYSGRNSPVSVCNTQDVYNKNKFMNCYIVPRLNLRITLGFSRKLSKRDLSGLIYIENFLTIIFKLTYKTLVEVADK